MTQTSNNLKAAAGFMLPGVVIMSAAILVIALAIAQLVIVNNQSIIRGMYEQIAQTAAKSGIDYAKEQFVATGTYTGTPEVTIVQNGQYRVTFQVTVLETSADGLEKKVEATGRVYLPEISTTQLLLRSIRSEIIRTVATELSPDQLGPMAWYDTSDTTTLHENASTTANWTHLNHEKEDYLNERTSNGTQTTASWNSAWLGLGYNSHLSSEAYAGNLFSMTGVPKTANITSAYMQLRSQGTSLGLSWIQINALDPSAVPASNSFSGPPTTNQLRNQPTIGPTTTWLDFTWPIDNLTYQTPNLRDQVQAVLNDPDYDPATDHIGFRFYRVFGIGNHRYRKMQASLVVNYTVSGVTTPSNGDLVTTWDDKSGNGRHLRAPAGREPTYRTAAQNGKAMLEFPNSGSSGKNMNSDPFNLVTQAEAGTIFIVSKGSAAAGNNASLVRLDGDIPAEPNCIGTSSCTRRIYEIARNGSSSGATFYIERTAGASASTQSVTFTPIFNDTPSMLTGGVAFGADSCMPSLEQAAADIANNSVLNTSCPSSGQSFPKSFKDGLRVKVGNGRNGTNLAGQIGEIILYDRQLSCQQVQSIQKYLRNKWFADTSNSHIITCPAPPIPGF